MTDTYAVMGNPVEHSLSPDIHHSFAKQTGQDMVYEKLCVPVDGFAEAVSDFFRRGGAGLNVTVPFKEEAYALAAVLTPRARVAKAVNTLWLGPEKQLCGDNTDGVGLVTDLTQRHQQVLRNSSLLVVGAGGAAHGVLAPLLAEKPKRVYVANRTVSRAVALVEALADKRLQACGFDELTAVRCDLVINATAASLRQAVPAIPADCVAGAFCYDMAYAPEATAFVRWAKAHGAVNAVDGLGMLLEQAARAFQIWRGILPDTQPLWQYFTVCWRSPTIRDKDSGFLG